MAHMVKLVIGVGLLSVNNMVWFGGHGSHSEVGDEGPLGDLNVEADALGLGAGVDHRAPDCGVGEAGGDAALHLVALDGDVIAADGLQRVGGWGYIGGGDGVVWLALQ